MVTKFLMMPDASAIHEVFGHRKTRARAHAVLDVLAEGEVYDKSGRAVRELLDRLPADVFDAPSDTQRVQAVTGVLGALESPGWVAREIHGKRTVRITLGPRRPNDWGAPSTNGHGPALALVADTAPAEVVDPYDAAEDADAAAEIGGRPGRFVARLQRELPALVADAVTAALDEDRRRVFVALGYAPPVAEGDADALVQANDALASLTGRVAELEHQLRDERHAAHTAREELNRVIGANERVVTSTLRPSDVHADVRDLAAHAIAHKWTIRRTNGGHLAFRSPAGSERFMSSTPSDWRAIKNFRSDLESLGLPRQGK